MLFDDPEAPTTTRRHFDYGAAHRWAGHRLGRASTPARSSSLDPGSRAPASPQRHRSRRRARARPPIRGRADLPGGRAGARAKQASNFLVVDPRRSATGNTPGGHGPAARLLLPGDRRSRSISPGPGIEAQGVAVPGRDDVPAHRAHPGLRLEPDLGRPRRARRLRRAALQPRRLGADARLRPLPVRGRVPPVRDLRRRHAQRHADPLPDVGARPGDRHARPSAAARSPSPASARPSGATGSTWPPSRT